MKMRTEFLQGKLTGNIKSGFPAGSGRMTLKNGRRKNLFGERK
jgi:hypothetical protein